MRIFKIIKCKKCQAENEINFNGYIYYGKCKYCKSDIKEKAYGDEYIYEQ